MVVRRIAAALVFAAIAAGGIDLRIARLVLGDRARLAAALERAPDRRTPAYPRFLEEVARRTENGQSIAILVPMRSWTDGYSYAFYRASYFLAGRRVVPLVDPDDSLHPERFEETALLAVWGMQPPPGGEILWQGHGGALLRRVR